MLPSAENAREHARALVHVKDGIEAEINIQLSILRENDCDMTTPLVDSEGFPRADLDIYAIRSARARIVVLRNDLKYTMDEIEKALQKVYDPSLAPPAASLAPPAPVDAPSTPNTHTKESLSPFAKVDGVAPGSPAAHAVCISPPICVPSCFTRRIKIGASPRRPHHKVWSSDNRLVPSFLSGTSG